jgi:hypothetical protein
MAYPQNLNQQGVKQDANNSVTLSPPVFPVYTHGDTVTKVINVDNNANVAQMYPTLNVVPNAYVIPNVVQPVQIIGPKMDDVTLLRIAVDDLSKKYDITLNEDLFSLALYELHIIIDDSISMIKKSDYSVYPRRWDEAKRLGEIVINIAGAINKNGINLHFLNRTGCNNVRSYNDVAPLFNDDPVGATPLIKVLKGIMTERPHVVKIIYICTDGLPTDDNYNEVPHDLEDLLKYRNTKNNRISILACTGEQKVIDMLDEIDNTVENIGVSDDYVNQKNQVLRIQGIEFPFSYADYAVCFMLSPINEKYNKLDVKKYILQGHKLIDPDIIRKQKNAQRHYDACSCSVQ